MALPPVPAGIDRQLAQLLERLREGAEVGAGDRGNPLDRNLTVRDLIDAGMIDVAATITKRRITGSDLIPVPTGGGESGGGTSPASPPAPTGFSATAGVTTVILEWDDPNTLYSNHAFASIYRNAVDDFSTAQLVHQSISFVHTDPVTPGAAFYYWVSFTSTSDVEGPPNALAGTLASTTKITGAQIGDGVISALQLASGAVEAAKVATNAITSDKIASGAVGTTKIADAAIASAKIADAAIVAAKIGDGAILSAKIQDAAVVEAKIGSLAVTSGKIADLAVGTAKIANLAVDSAKIDALAVTEAKIANLAVTTGKIADANITSAKIADLAVGSAKIADAAIQEAKIADLAVISAKIADAAVDTLQLAGQAVTIPVASYASGSTNLAGVELLAQVTIVSTGAPIDLVFSAQATATSNPMVAYFSIQRGSTTIFDQGSGAYISLNEERQFSFSLQDTPGAGPFTYYLYGVGVGLGTVTVRRRFLRALETKR